MSEKSGLECNDSLISPSLGSARNLQMSLTSQESLTLGLRGYQGIPLLLIFSFLWIVSAFLMTSDLMGAMHEPWIRIDRHQGKTQCLNLPSFLRLPLLLIKHLNSVWLLDGSLPWFMLNNRRLESLKRECVLQWLLKLSVRTKISYAVPSEFVFDDWRNWWLEEFWNMCICLNNTI